MECQHIARFLAVIICAHSTFGATTVNGPAAVEQGQNAVFTCTSDNPPATLLYAWYDGSVDPPQQIFDDLIPVYGNRDEYNNFAVSDEGAKMTINMTAINDESEYICTITGENSERHDFTVEVGSTLTMTLSTTDPLRDGTDFTATCDVIGSRPQLAIAWTLNDNALNATPVVINPTNTNTNLSDTTSVVTITAIPAMNDQDLKCITSGNVVTSLNREATTQLNVEYPPTSQTATVVVDATTEGDTQLRVTCQVSAIDNSVASANPAINNYTIYAGSEQIHSSTTNNSVLVDIPENATDYECSAGNDLGTMKSAAVNYDPGQTTTQPTTTEPTTSEPSTTEAPAGGLSTAAIVGTVIGVLLFIALVVVLVVICVLKPDCISGKGSGPPPKTMALQEQKPTNGNSEKVAHPTAAPRQSTVPHRNDNPGGAVYAEVQKGGRGYDQPDHTHPPQGDSGMNYATLDLSEEAGHTERQVPQNKDNVVVYSSILV